MTFSGGSQGTAREPLGNFRRPGAGLHEQGAPQPTAVVMEDDLYGDLVTSAGDAGAGLLKEKVCVLAAPVTCAMSGPRHSPDIKLNDAAVGCRARGTCSGAGGTAHSADDASR